MIKNKELGFGPPIGEVADSGVLQVLFRPLRHASRVALVDGARDRILHVTHHTESWKFGKRIHAGGVRIGKDQHVAVLNRFPSADGRPVKSRAILK